MRKLVGAFLLAILLVCGVAIFVNATTSTSYETKAAAYHAVVSDDMEALQALKSKSIHRAAVKRWREQQVHLEQLRISRSKERAAKIARSAPTVPTDSIWDAVAECESSGRWDYNGSSGYDGGLQFHPTTWADNKFPGYPDYAYQATREQQIAVAEKVLAESTWAQQWPACSLKLGLRKE